MANVKINKQRLKQTRHGVGRFSYQSRDTFTLQLHTPLRVAVMAVPPAAVHGRRLVGARLVEPIAEEVGHGGRRAEPPAPGGQGLRCEAVGDLQVEVAALQGRAHPQRELGHGARTLEQEVAPGQGQG